MLLSIIAVGFASPLIGEKPEVLIGVISIIAIVFSTKWELRDSKIPDWKILLESAAIGMGLIISISLLLSILFQAPISSQLIIVAPLMALIDNRKIARRKMLVLSTEIIFQFVLIVQMIAIISISRGIIIFSIIAIPISFWLCFWAYRIERKIEEQINARQDE